MSTDQLPGWRHMGSGKIRELYEPIAPHPAGDVLLLVATDRISAFDHVLPTEIPDKGKVLTAMSLWWFDRLADIVPGHVVGLDVPEAVRGRAMVCHRLQMYPVECVARGYLTGSGLAEYTSYTSGGSVCGIALPDGLQDGSRLPRPLFTPATKAEIGEHDENITYDELVERVGQADAQALREVTLAVYARAEEIARARGVLLADTKLEFGRDADGDLVLGDEVLTPDSSRYWPAETWQPGRAQPSWDKQYVRDWLTGPAGWDRAGGAPPPALPPEVVDRTRARYLHAYEQLVGEPLDV